MTEETGKHLSQVLMAILILAGFWMEWRQRKGKPASRAFTQFYTAGGRQGSYYWTMLLVIWFVGGWLPLLAFPGMEWIAYVYFAGTIFLAGKAMGFWKRRKEEGHE